MNLFSKLDFFVIPLLLIMVCVFAHLYQQKLVRAQHPARRHFLPGFYFKMLLLFFSAGMIHFTGNKSDTNGYYLETFKLFHVFLDAPQHFFQFVFLPYMDLPAHIQQLFPLDYFYTAVNHSTAKIMGYALPFTILSFGSYWGGAMGFSLISFWGSWKLYVLLSQKFKVFEKAFRYGLFFIPSVVFWCSGINKDSISHGFTLLFVYAALSLTWQKFKITHVVLLLVSGFMVINIKSYLLFTFLPFLGIYYLVYHAANKKRLLRGLVVLLVIAAMLFRSENILGRFALETIIDEALTQQQGYASLEQGSAIQVADVGSSFASVLFQLPMAFFITFFRPFIWDVRNPLMLFSALENLIPLFLVVQIFLKRTKHKLGAKYKTFIIVFFFYAAITGAFIGLTNPNLGTLSRYRAIPFQFFIICTTIIYLNDKKRLHQSI